MIILLSLFQKSKLFGKLFVTNNYVLIDKSIISIFFKNNGRNKTKLTGITFDHFGKLIRNEKKSKFLKENEFFY